jgi:hypothetical protein
VSACETDSRRRTSLRSNDASRERPSMSEVKIGILAYRNFVKSFALFSSLRLSQTALQPKGQEAGYAFRIAVAMAAPDEVGFRNLL